MPSLDMTSCEESCHLSGRDTYTKPKPLCGAVSSVGEIFETTNREVEGGVVLFTPIPRDPPGIFSPCPCSVQHCGTRGLASQTGRVPLGTHHET